MATSTGLGAVRILMFGAVLNQLASKIGSLINDAENAGEVLLSSSGRPGSLGDRVRQGELPGRSEHVAR